MNLGESPTTPTGNELSQNQFLKDSGIPLDWVLRVPPSFGEPEYLAGDQSNIDGVMIVRHLRLRTAGTTGVNNASYAYLKYFRAQGWKLADRSEDRGVMDFSNPIQRERLRISLTQDGERVIAELIDYKYVN